MSVKRYDVSYAAWLMTDTQVVLASDYDELRERVKALEEALIDISGQMTTKELASACVCDPDIEFGYDEIIRVARKALEATC